MTTATSPKPPPPPPPKAPPPPPQNGAASGKAKAFAVAGGVLSQPQRVVIYGSGGVGKSSLAGLAPSPVFVDIDKGTGHLDVRRVGGVESWQDMRDALHEPSLWTGCETVVIDSGTAAQEFAVAHALATIRHEQGHKVESIEGYGFGKGYTHVYEVFMQLLGDLDNHVRAGRNTILICHEVTEKAPNPEGEDHLRYEPALQQPGKVGRIRDRVKHWCDHLLYIGYDKAVTKGKAVGKGTRTIYSSERPTYWAKSRSIREPMEYIEGSPAVWDALLGKVVA